MWHCHESLVLALHASRSNISPATYVCFNPPLDDEVDVDLESDMFPFSSSMCTAIENRRQKAGSRTPAMIDMVRPQRGEFVGLFDFSLLPFWSKRFEEFFRRREVVARGV